MFKSRLRSILVLGLICGLVGCSLAPKKSKTATTLSTSSSPFGSSAKKVQTDLSQTEADLGSLESEIKVGK